MSLPTVPVTTTSWPVPLSAASSLFRGSSELTLHPRDPRSWRATEPTDSDLTCEPALFDVNLHNLAPEGFARKSFQRRVAPIAGRFRYRPDRSCTRCRTWHATGLRRASSVRPNRPALAPSCAGLPRQQSWRAREPRASRRHRPRQSIWITPSPSTRCAGTRALGSIPAAVSVASSPA